MKKVHLVRVIIDCEIKSEYFNTKKEMKAFIDHFNKKYAKEVEQQINWIDLVIEDITGSITEDGNKLR